MAPKVLYNLIPGTNEYVMEGIKVADGIKFVNQTWR